MADLGAKARHPVLSPEINSEDSLVKPLKIEIIYKGHQCPSSFYMAKAVEAVVPRYGNHVEVIKVAFYASREYACRLYQLSVSLYGEEAVRKQGRLAPIPSLFFNGELVFNHIPPQDELIQAIDFFLLQGEMPFKKEGLYEN
jgi:hypothetical protein